MIESVKIAGYASYCKEPVVLAGLKERNYFFGSNGTGKSSIGKVIADDTIAEACEVVWKDNQQVRTMVYNLDFIEENFGTSGGDFKGVCSRSAKTPKRRKSV